MSDTRKDLPPVSAANFLARVREVLQVYLGSQGSELDRGLTVRDIVGTGLATLNPNGGSDTLLVPSVPTGGTGGGSSEVYEPDLTIPPSPSSFTAVAGLTSIIVETEPPIYSAGHGHGVARLFGVTRLAGDPLPTFASAVELSQFQGDVTSYATGLGKIWHLWLIWRSKDGVDSAPAGGTNGVSVTTGKIGNADVSDLAIEASKLAEGAIDLTSNKVKASASFGALAVGYTVTQYLVSTSGVMGNLVVDNAQISGLSAAKLTVGDGTIGGNLKSTNYVAGSSGWIVRPDGTAEFGFAHIRGTLQASQVAANFITAAMIDARGLSIKDASGNVILSAGSAVDWTKLGGASSNLSGLGYTGALDATRNVYRGAWATAVAYTAGDVVTSAGSSWSARTNHTSATGTNNPPTLPTTSNTWWELSAAKGDVGSTGPASISVVLSNEAHVLPATSDGTVSSYTGSGTEIRVYEGATELTYDGVGTANGSWKVTTTPTNITPGTLTDSGTYLTVGAHSAVSTGTDTSSITYTITGKSASGAGFTLTKTQTFTKSKQGAGGSTGLTGPAGPSVLVTASRATTFTATDGALDAAQADITFTAAVSGISSPTYVWSFSGFQTAPTNSGVATQTVTAAQFGTSKSATVTCTVSGTYKDGVTIVRLEKSTAAAGATVGAPSGTQVGGRDVATLLTDVDTAKSSAASAISNLNEKLDKAGGTISGRVNMSVADGIFAGSDLNNGVYMGNGGIVGKKAGATTFAIDAAGDASFAGALVGATGTFSGALNAATGSYSGSLNAATGTFSGTMTAAAVNAVDTINIAGNAVTVPVSAQWSGSVLSGPSYGFSTLVSTASTNFGGGGVHIVAMLTGVLTDTENYQQQAPAARLLRNGTQIAQFFGWSSLDKGGAIVSVLDNPGAGSHTYTLQFSPWAQVFRAEQASILVLGVKR